MTPWVLAVIVPACAATAGLLVRVYGDAPRTRSLWWIAALGAGGAAVLAASSSVPVAAAIAGSGLAAAALIDAVETRIPAPIAHGTTLCSAFALLVDAWRSADWAPAWTAAAWTAGIVVVFVALWLAGGMGYGDVRLAASTVTASVAGPAGAMTLLWGAFATAGLTAVFRGRRSSPDGRPARVPFGPALAAGWLLAVTLT